LLPREHSSSLTDTTDLGRKPLPGAFQAVPISPCQNPILLVPPQASAPIFTAFRRQWHLGPPTACSGNNVTASYFPEGTVASGTSGALSLHLGKPGPRSLRVVWLRHRSRHFRTSIKDLAAPPFFPLRSDFPATHPATSRALHRPILANRATTAGPDDLSF